MYTLPSIPALAALNELRYGDVYCAVTSAGDTTGEYLGVETSHGVWSILLRNEFGTDSVPFSRIEAVAPAA